MSGLSVTDVQNWSVSPGSNPNVNGPVGPFTVTDEAGTTYFFGGNGIYDQTNQVNWSYPNLIEDRNGNTITLVNGVFIDTLGRPMWQSASIGGLVYPTATCVGSCPSSNPVNYQVPSHLGWNGMSYLPGDTSVLCPTSTAVMSVSASSPSGIGAFALPTSTASNPQQYNFYYGGNTNGGTANPYGLLNEVIYPDGGWVKYTWQMSTSASVSISGTGSFSEMGAFEGQGQTSPGVYSGNPYPSACLIYYATPVLASRVVSYDGVNTAQTQTFSYSTTWGTGGQNGYDWTTKQTQVITTDNVTGASYLTVYNYGPSGIPGGGPAPFSNGGVAAEIPVETSVLYYSGTSTSSPLLRTVTKGWYDMFHLAEEDTTENGLTSKTVYSYQAPSPTSPFTLLTGKSEYDFGASTPTQTTTINYQTFTPNTITYQSTAVIVPVPSAPSSVIVTNSAGTSLAETDYGYDSYGSGLASVTAVQHDGTNYGAGMTNRGNLTSMTKKCFNCTSATTTYMYDLTGQPASMTDPNGNKTTYYFTDSPSGGNAAGNSNAYLTQVVYPKTGSIVHQEYFQYNYTFGDLTQSTDENSQITTYAYVDPFDRLTASIFPDTGRTNIAYNDSPTSPSVTTCQLITGSASAACSATSPPTGWKTSVALMDGMFRTKQTQLVSDPDGEDYVDTTYDGLGRKKTVSNPHRTASSSTDGTTSTTYDVLGRPILVTEQDGSTVQTLYDQTCNTNTNTLGTTVIDEAGHKRTSCTDGLGRLVEVDEPAVSSTSTPGQGTVTVNTAGSLSCTSDGHGGWIPMNGSLSITVNGVEEAIGYGGTCNGSTQTLIPTPAVMASGLASLLSGSAAGVTAQATGTTIQITSNAEGSNTNYALSVSPTSGPVYLSASGATLTGGTGASTLTPFVTLYNYDALGNLLCVEQHGGAPSSYGCSSAASNDINSQWRIRRFSYDSLSRLLTAENPETGGLPGQIYYTYDANSNLVSKKALSPNQPSTGTATVTTSYTYDALNRLTGKNYTDTDSSNNGLTLLVQYGYDGVALTGCAIAPPSQTDSYPIGARTSMCDGSGGTTWVHDQMGRVQQERRAIGRTGVNNHVDYVYNPDGSIKTLQTPPMKTLIYSIGGAGRPTQLVDSTDGINFVTNATYAPPGELQSLTNGGAIHGALSYNSRLQPLQIFYGTNTPPTLTGSTCPGTVGNIMHRVYNFSLGSGDNGNVLSIANCRDTTRSQSFTYDALNRIASGESSGPQWGENFIIDPWGNLYGRSGISGKTYYESLSVTATNLNRLTGYGYDPTGNMTSNGGTNYVYDDENRLIWTSGELYVYDGNGERVEKCQAASATAACPTSGTTGTLYWRGISGNTAGETLAETDLGGNQQEEYLFFNGQRVARRDVTSSGATIAVHYYFSDYLGTHTVVENATGTACEQDADYYPYGGEQNDYCTTQVAQRYKFTGKERDSESGLDNFGARYDASSLGRFMTPDWAEKPTAVPFAHFGNPQSLNLYGYVENNPTTSGDPDGHGQCNFFRWLSGFCPKGNDSSNQTAQTPAQPAQTTAAATVAAPTTMEAVDAVVKPLVDSAVGALVKTGATLLDIGAAGLIGAAYLISPQGGEHRERDAEIAQEKRMDAKEEAAEAQAAAGGAGKGRIPGHPFTGTNAARDAFQHLAKFHGVDPTVASERLHQIKERARLGAADNAVIGRTGDVYNPYTGEHIGSLTSSH